MSNADMDRLLDDGVKTALHFLRTSGEFFPFAVVATQPGDIRHVNMLMEDDRPESDEVKGLLRRSLQSQAADGRIIAAAIVSNVSLPNIPKSPNSAIAAVQPAQSRFTDNAPPPLDGPAERRLLAQGKVSAVAVVIGHIGRHQAPQVRRAKDDDMIEAFAPD